MQSLEYMGEANIVGPLLMGTRLPAHILQYGAVWRVSSILQRLQLRKQRSSGKPRPAGSALHGGTKDCQRSTVRRSSCWIRGPSQERA